MNTEDPLSKSVIDPIEILGEKMDVSLNNCNSVPVINSQSSFTPLGPSYSTLKTLTEVVNSLSRLPVTDLLSEENNLFNSASPTVWKVGISSTPEGKERITTESSCQTMPLTEEDVKQIERLRYLTAQNSRGTVSHNEPTTNGISPNKPIPGRPHRLLSGPPKNAPIPHASVPVTQLATQIEEPVLISSTPQTCSESSNNKSVSHLTFNSKNDALSTIENILSSETPHADSKLAMSCESSSSSSSLREIALDNNIPAMSTPPRELNPTLHDNINYSGNEINSHNVSNSHTSITSSNADRYTIPYSPVAIPPSRNADYLLELMDHQRRRAISVNQSQPNQINESVTPLDVQAWTYYSTNHRLCTTDSEADSEFDGIHYFPPTDKHEEEKITNLSSSSNNVIHDIKLLDTGRTLAVSDESSPSESNHVSNYDESSGKKQDDMKSEGNHDKSTESPQGTLFHVKYLGSTRLFNTNEKPNKALRVLQAQEALERIKVGEDENQPSSPVQLFVSIQRLLVLSANFQVPMMDYSLRSIAYIADFGDIIIVMARNLPAVSSTVTDSLESCDTNGSTQEGGNKEKLISSSVDKRIVCHVFQSTESKVIAQTIGKAFQSAYVEFLRSNGIDEKSSNLLKEMDYQDVLNQQQLHTDELHMLANKESQKEVILSKTIGEPLGLMIVESGWGSMVPTVVVSNLLPTGPAARGGQINIGNQIIAVNQTSLVGLPLSKCQQILKKCRRLDTVTLTLICSSPVVDVFIRRPSKYQLGFSVQNGVVCSLLRGGIAERGGIRVGHRIIEVNGQSVVAMPHERIVNLLASAVGQIHIRTMPATIFRLLTGQDSPHYL